MLSVISVTELFFSFKSAAAAVYLYFPAAFLAMLLYLIMTLSPPGCCGCGSAPFRRGKLRTDRRSLFPGCSGAGPNDKEATV